LQNVNSAA